MRASYQIEADRLIEDGWCVIYYDGGVIAHQPCPWCENKRRPLKKCSVCNGSGVRASRRLTGIFDPEAGV